MGRVLPFPLVGAYHSARISYAAIVQLMRDRKETAMVCRLLNELGDSVHATAQKIWRATQVLCFDVLFSFLHFTFFICLSFFHSKRIEESSVAF